VLQDQGPAEARGDARSRHTGVRHGSRLQDLEGEDVLCAQHADQRGRHRQGHREPDRAAADFRLEPGRSDLLQGQLPERRPGPDGRGPVRRPHGDEAEGDARLYADGTGDGDRIRVFSVLNTTPGGALGNRAATTAMCVSAANAQGLSCTSTVALLAYGGGDDIASLPSNHGVPSGTPIVAAGSQVQIADDWADLLDGSWDTCVGLGCNPRQAGGQGEGVWQRLIFGCSVNFPGWSRLSAPQGDEPGRALPRSVSPARFACNDESAPAAPPPGLVPSSFVEAW
jgi:hypothetical protein